MVAAEYQCPYVLHMQTVCLCAGYALGFFQGSASVAYGADHILDLIPCDAVASLVITAAAAASAAAAAGDTAAGRPTAASADAAGCLAAPADSAASARTTAALAPGSTAVSLQDSGSTTIYHAASSGSYPLSILTAYVLMHDYFRHNPAPLRLPFTRWAVTPAGIRGGWLNRHST